MVETWRLHLIRQNIKRVKMLSFMQLMVKCII